MTTTSLRPTAVLALPLTVDSAAWATPIDEELRLWINHPGAGETAQLRVLRGNAFEALSSLPIVAAGAARCGSEIVMTGADAEGHPVVLGVAEDGNVRWRFLIDGPTPIRWPIPGCAPEPVVVWQTSHGEIERARVGPQGLDRRRSVRVGGPPLDLTTGGGAIWAVWSDESGVHAVEMGRERAREIFINAAVPDGVAVGGFEEGAWVAWTRGASAFLVSVSPGKHPSAPVAIDIAGASGGTLAVVAGPEPLLWIRHGEALEGEPPRWRSAFVLPGREPTLVEGLVHAVTWWGDAVAVVGTTDVRLFER